MSKVSAKQRYFQLMEWLPTCTTKKSKGVKQKESRLEYYQKVNAR